MTVIQAKPNALYESGKISLLIGLGIASKMVVDLVIAARFGLGAKTDAFFVAYTLPLIIEALIYPACQSGLVPVFVRQMRPDPTHDKWTIFSTLFNVGLLTSIALLAIGVTTAPWTTMLLAPGLPASSYEMTVHLMRILFVDTLIVGPVGVMRAFLNAHGLFTAPAMLELVRGTAVLGTIAVAQAKVVYVCNLVAKHGETDGFRASDFILEIQRYLGSPERLDAAIINQSDALEALLEQYC